MDDLRTFEPYTLHYFDVSYFSGKMQAYLGYKGIPHLRHEVPMTELTTRIAEHTGLAEVPTIERADGVFLRDTTAMIEWFEERYPSAAVLPTDPAAAFFCRFLEDYADEGLWRPALYYRWAFRKDALLNVRRFTEEFLSFPLTPAFALRWQVRARQRRTYMAGLGVTPANKSDVEQHYRDELRDLENIFRGRPFLFGERPSLADFGYFASMFRHFSLDPTPARIMRDTAPAVFEWVARLWNARASSIGDVAWAPTTNGLPLGIEPLLARAARRYLPALHANARAVAAQQTTYDVELDGKPYRGLCAVPFQAWRRAVLQRELAALPAGAASSVRTTLSDAGCLEWLERDGVLPHHYPQGDLLPLCGPRTFSLGEKLRTRIFGTPNHQEVGRTTAKRQPQ